ncbi:MAG TPA: DUF3322 domain-containing protein [Gammaproteobacteria bacterium]|nr:DUF3322 domain-containing protein [Gammaproteobacteria bacterium]
MSHAPRWTTPEQLRQQVERRWQRGELLAAQVNGDALFPLRLRLRHPTGGEIANDYSAVRDWIQELRSGSRDNRGFGYELEWQEARNRVHGTNLIPVSANVPSARDAFRLVGRERDAKRFSEIVETTTKSQPDLVPWMIRHPLKALGHAGSWEMLLRVVAWFQKNPRPGLYLRQLDIEGVDTKFIESHRGLISELLDQALPSEAIDREHTGVRGFEERYGLRQRPARVRFRLLDPDLYVRGVTDLTVPLEEFAHLGLDESKAGVRTVFITENEINGLAFPDLPRCAVIFGLGYALDRLGEIPWLHRVDVRYWGDIDTHGFAILDRLRHHLPDVRSLLMDRATMEAHRELWVQEDSRQRFQGTPGLLTEPELSIFKALRDNELGTNVRLEQERIRYGWVHKYVNSH